MTDGPLDAGDDKRDDKALDASPAAAPAADPATLASATEAPAAHSDDTEAEDTAASTVDEGGEDDEVDDDDDGDEEEEEEDDEEPKLKYARLTPHLGAVYRNADATSSFLVAGDKMIIGSHNGNIVSHICTPSEILPPVNVSVACHTTASVPVATGLSRPFRFCNLDLDLSLPSANILEAET